MSPCWWIVVNAISMSVNVWVATQSEVPRVARVVCGTGAIFSLASLVGNAIKVCGVSR